MFWVIVVIIGLALILLKYVGILVLIILVIAGIYALFKFTKTKITESNNNKKKTKKERIVAELSEEIKWREDVFKEIESFFSIRKKNIMFLKLITTCAGTTAALERYEELESEAFNELKNTVLSKEKKRNSYAFPEKIADISGFVDSRKKEIEKYKNVLNSVASADTAKLDEIIESHCPKISKENSAKRRKRIALFLLIIIISLVLIIVPSTGFAQIIAENYHKSVLNENIIELGYKNLVVNDVEYEKHTSYYDDDNERNYYTTIIKLSCSTSLDECLGKDFNYSTNRLYNKMKTTITYNWAGKKLTFENDSDFIVIVVDSLGKEMTIEAN